jgi:O-antigen/teichoic acid export membrane protein
MSPTVAPEEEAQATDISGKTGRGSLWLGSQKVVQQITTLLQLTILARLLSPEAFGLMGIALLAVRLLEVFTYTGMEYAVIQRPVLTETDTHTAWWVLLIRRLLLAAILFALAAPIATLFEEPAAESLLRVLAFGQIILGLTSLSPILFQRDLLFQKQVTISVAGLIGGAIAAIVSAYILRTAWALVIGTLVAATVTTIVSYQLHPYRPKRAFSRTTAKQFFNFGQWMFASALLFYAVSQGADALSGILFGAAALGLYQVSSRFAMLPSSHFGDVILNAAMPSYVKIQDQPDRLQNAFIRVLRITLIAIMPATLLLVFILPPLVGVILGEQWLDAAELIPVIALAGFLQAFARTGSPLFLATGNPRIQLLMDLVGALALFALFYPLSQTLGIVGLAWAVVLSSFMGIGVWYFAVKRLSGINTFQIIKTIVPAMLSALLVSPLLYAGAQLIEAAQGPVVKLLLAALISLPLMLLFIAIVELLCIATRQKRALTELSAILPFALPRQIKILFQV